MKTLVLTFIAQDRPGLVEQLSEAVSAAGGNWLESRMARLAEKFAGIARVEIADEKVSTLKAALAALEAAGFTLTMEEAAADAASAGPLYSLELLGPDQPGIVHDVSRCLSEHGVSVEEMETSIRHAPMGGDMLFETQAKVRVPPGLSENSLRDALEALAGAMMVDITLREEDTAAGR
ncbi:MAG: glycine cleavage system protein R [Alphaproteobacteria bacterium]|nr:glycine cleavage system protein R [Alphaproteobacteria bacterium]